MRTAILELHGKGVGKKRIARLLGVSKGAIGGVIASKSAAVPPLERREKADPHRGEIPRLTEECEGNLVRVHEELGAGLSYSTLTAFCRREGLGHELRRAQGSHDFAPGQEQQHDTSPHEVKLSSVKTKAQTASSVLCFSRRLFFNQTRDFNYVVDTARAILTAGLCEDAIGRVMNIGSGRETSVNEIARAVIEVVGNPRVEVVHDAPRPGDIARMCADGSREREILGYAPEVPLAVGLARLAETRTN